MNELKSASFKTLAVLALGLLTVQAAAATGESAAGGRRARAADSGPTVEGKVVERSHPIAEATVYAYEVATYTIQKVLTDGRGRFLFGSLPAGMYKLIAYKDGFAPTVALLLRRRAEDNQYVEIEIREEAVGDARQSEDYWSVRSQVPSDVLRDIHRLWTHDEGVIEPGTRIAGLSGFEGEMLAHGGMEQLGEAHGEAQLTGAEFDLRGSFGAMQVDVAGRYQSLVQDAAGQGSVPGAEARSVAVAVESPGDSKLRVTTSTGQVDNAGEGMAPVDLEHYQLQWSGRTGKRGKSNVTAHYTEEANYHQAGGVNPLVIPEASRTWHLKGHYNGELTERTSLQAGVTYRQRAGEAAYLASLSEGRPDLDPLVSTRSRVGDARTPETLSINTIWLPARAMAVIDLRSSDSSRL